jgi:hypothetical protein
MRNPTPSSRRRWLRFSLASLLVVTTVLCIALAVVFNRVRRQERAVRAIQAAGGYIRFDYELRYLNQNPFVSDLNVAPVPGPLWLRRYLGDELFRSPIRVTFKSYDQAVNDALLIEHLAGVRTAETLFIDSPYITDASMPQIGAMSRVDFLDLSNAPITDDGLRHVAGMRQLHTLQLFCPQITDAGLEHLQGLSLLERLRLDSPRLTPAGVRRLKGLASVTNVTSLRSQEHYRLIDTLRRSHSLDPLDTPLLAALEALAEDAGLPIDTSNLLPDHGPAPFRATTASTVEGCLEEILEPAGLGWYLDSGRVKITTRELARERRAGYYAFRETFPNAALIVVDW